MQSVKWAGWRRIAAAVESFFVETAAIKKVLSAEKYR
jgi:hypothetical protein